MHFGHKGNDELLKIVQAGGSVKFNGRHKSTEELAELAGVASISGASLYIGGMSKKSADELAIIASAGPGCVTFED